MAKNIPSNPNSIMEKLLASSPKISKISRGQQVEGVVLTKTNREVVLEIGAKSEGVLYAKDLSADAFENLKVGDKLLSYVVGEDESGQIALTMHQSSLVPQKTRGGNWGKFQKAQDQKTKLQGKVLEINKGGLIVEVEGTRGFLPNSQVGFELLASAKQGLGALVGQQVNLTVVEINTNENRLIFSQRGQVSDAVLAKLKSYKAGQKVKGKIVAILPFGLVIDLDGVEGLVFISDVAWEKIEDLSSKFKVGEEVEAQVLGEDSELGRVNLSLKHLIEDPFAQIAQKYPTDEVVKGEILEVNDTGVSVKLVGVEGFLPASKIGDTKYEVGSSMSFLVDSVDSNRRRVNLAPFFTSTAGLIYK